MDGGAEEDEEEEEQQQQPDEATAQQAAELLTKKGKKDQRSKKKGGQGKQKAAAAGEMDPTFAFDEADDGVRVHVYVGKMDGWIGRNTTTRTGRLTKPQLTLPYSVNPRQ